MDDTSLDDFLAADGSEAASEDAAEEREPDADESDSLSDTEATDDTENAVDPATTTSQWDASGVVCPVCEETVHRVWESADGLVCVTCKEW